MNSVSNHDPLALVPLFASLQADERALLLEQMQLVSLRKGEYLVRQGEEADCLYYVLRGRLDVLRDGHQLVAEIGTGEPVGEIAFFADTLRTADVMASRDSQLLRLGRNEFEQVSALQPQLVQSILRTFGRRLASATTGAPVLPPRVPDTIGLCPAGSSVLPPDLVQDLCAALVKQAGSCHVLGAGDLPEGLDPGNEHLLSEWLAMQEKAHGRLLIVTGQGNPRWDQAALRHCDQLLLCGQLDLADGQDQAVPLAELEADMLGRFRNRHIGLLLWREHSHQAIANTRRWLANRPAHLHHHVVRGNPAHFQRVARLLTGRALGAVFGGGGALGAGHIGALRALFEAGLELDIVGGTSIGSSVAMACAAGEDPRQMMEAFNYFFLKKKAFGRYTPPVYGLVDQRHVDASMRERYGASRLEDLDLNCYVVAANLSTNQSEILRSGPCWEAMRMSASIPVALPPWINARGDVLVDGGLVDNVPASVMHAIKPGPNLVFMLSPGERWQVKTDYNTLPSRLGQLWQMLRGAQAGDDFPRIGQTVARSMQIASNNSLLASRHSGDRLVQPPTVPGMALTAWKMGNAQEQAGYDYACRWLEQQGGLEALLAWRDGTR
jgi:NTE family protein